MIPNSINVEEFAKNLSEQAASVFPEGLPANLKTIVIQTVNDFIKIAGNALAQEENSYNENDTVLICQLVGEWMFHKGIDNYKNEIPEEYWVPILQQLAFAVFDASKNSILAGKTQDEVINIAESTISKTYQDLIQQLANENKLTKSVDEIMGQSNLKDYVEHSHDEGISAEQEEKDLKLMAIALFFKSLSPDDVGKMVKNLKEEDKRQILTYMQMQDLERLVDPVIYNQYLEKFNNFMPKVQQKKQKNAMHQKMSNVFSDINNEKFEYIIKNERKNVKNFLLHTYNGKILEEELFSSDLTNVIVDYIAQKANN